MINVAEFQKCKKSVDEMCVQCTCLIFSGQLVREFYHEVYRLEELNLPI